MRPDNNSASQLRDELRRGAERAADGGPAELARYRATVALVFIGAIFAGALQSQRR